MDPSVEREKQKLIRFLDGFLQELSDVEKIDSHAVRLPAHQESPTDKMRQNAIAVRQRLADSGSVEDLQRCESVLQMLLANLMAYRIALRAHPKY